MKKGLRPPWRPGPTGCAGQNRRPDEEGIKTRLLAGGRLHSLVRTVDLMKKGLRPDHTPSPSTGHGQNRRPDEEGIKTRPAMRSVASMWGQNRRPDEEGIKTPVFAAIAASGGQNRRPDEEGIKTGVGGIHPTTSGVRTVDLMKKGLRP